MNELVDFVYDNYPAIHGKITKKQIENLLRIYNKQVIVIKEKEGVFVKKDKIKGVGFYFKLSDKNLTDVKSRMLDIGNSNNAVYLLKDNGRNVHFVFLVAKKVKVILRGLREVIRRESPKTISWFNPSMEQFFIRKIQT